MSCERTCLYKYDTVSEGATTGSRTRQYMYIETYFYVL